MCFYVFFVGRTGFGTQILVTLHGGGHQKLLSFNLRQRGVRCPFALATWFHVSRRKGGGESWLVPLKIRIGIEMVLKFYVFKVGDLTRRQRMTITQILHATARLKLRQLIKHGDPDFFTLLHRQRCAQRWNGCLRRGQITGIRSGYLAKILSIGHVSIAAVKGGYEFSNIYGTDTWCTI